MAKRIVLQELQTKENGAKSVSHLHSYREKNTNAVDCSIAQTLLVELPDASSQTKLPAASTRAFESEVVGIVALLLLPDSTPP